MRPGLESWLRDRRDRGQKLLVPYVTGGLGDDWADVVRAVVSAGADAVEIGIPFSDPVMDGPTIQKASTMALKQGTTPAGVISELARIDVDVPLAVMTYYNLIYHAGHQRMAHDLHMAGVAGAIVPDLPLEELDPWAAAADAAGIETVLLVAPSTPDSRVSSICERSRGFVYGVAVMGVTGERSDLGDTARQMAKRLKAATDKPVLIGVGVSNPAQARQVCEHADGVIVGSALVRRVLEGGGPEGASAFIKELRAGLDG